MATAVVNRDWQVDHFEIRKRLGIGNTTLGRSQYRTWSSVSVPGLRQLEYVRNGQIWVPPVDSDTDWNGYITAERRARDDGYTLQEVSRHDHGRMGVFLIPSRTKETSRATEPGLRILIMCRHCLALVPTDRYRRHLIGQKTAVKCGPPQWHSKFLAVRAAWGIVNTSSFGPDLGGDRNTAVKTLPLGPLSDWVGDTFGVEVMDVFAAITGVDQNAQLRQYDYNINDVYTR